MARTGSKDTKPELTVRKLLHGLGYRRTTTPGTRTSYWTQKFDQNVVRELRNLTDLGGHRGDSAAGRARRCHCRCDGSGPGRG